VRVHCHPDGRVAGDAEVAALDAFAIVKEMVDAAGERGETGPLEPKRRVQLAVFGYLGARR
jgi:hypothetical protein